MPKKDGSRQSSLCQPPLLLACGLKALVSFPSEFIIESSLLTYSVLRTRYSVLLPRYLLVHQLRSLGCGIHVSHTPNLPTNRTMAYQGYPYGRESNRVEHVSRPVASGLEN